MSFRTIMFDSPATPRPQSTIEHINPALRPEAEAKCLKAGIPRTAADIFEACVFDAATGGIELGQVMADNAGIVYVLRNQDLPEPDQRTCETTEVERAPRSPLRTTTTQQRIDCRETTPLETTPRKTIPRETETIPEQTEIPENQ